MAATTGPDAGWVLVHLKIAQVLERIAACMGVGVIQWRTGDRYAKIF